MKELYILLAERGLSPNGLYVLQAADAGLALPGLVNLPVEQRRLVVEGFLEEHPTTCASVCRITDKGRQVLLEAENALDLRSRKGRGKVSFAEWEGQIREFISLFPTGKQGAQPIRTNPKMMLDRFRWFFGEFPEYSWEDVLKATETYIESLQESNDGMRYVSTAKYFVKKEEKDRSVRSLLADWCEALARGEEADLSPHVGKKYFGSQIV